MIDFLPLIGLLANYLQEKRSQKDAHDLTFKLWLDHHHHNDLVARFAAAGCSLDALEIFAKDHTEKLDSITKLLEGMSAQLMAPSGAVPAGREQVLSEQAISILRQLLAAKASGFSSAKTRGGLVLSGGIQYSDAQFIDDDLNTLVQLGMLICTPNSSGFTYKITRRASSLIATLDTPT